MTVALLGGVANWRPVLQPVAPSATIRAEHTLRLVRLGQQDLARLQEVLKLSTLRRVSVQEWSTFTSGPLSHRKNWWFRGRTMKLGARTRASSTKAMSLSASSKHRSPPIPPNVKRVCPTRSPPSREEVVRSARTFLTQHSAVSLESAASQPRSEGPTGGPTGPTPKPPSPLNQSRQGRKVARERVRLTRFNRDT